VGKYRAASLHLRQRHRTLSKSQTPNLSYDRTASVTKTQQLLQSSAPPSYATALRLIEKPAEKPTPMTNPAPQSFTKKAGNPGKSPETSLRLPMAGAESENAARMKMASEQQLYIEEYSTLDGGWYFPGGHAMERRLLSSLERSKSFATSRRVTSSLNESSGRTSQKYRERRKCQGPSENVFKHDRHFAHNPSRRIQGVLLPPSKSTEKPLMIESSSSPRYDQSVNPTVIVLCAPEIQNDDGQVSHSWLPHEPHPCVRNGQIALL
jgi:hypothetical protein